MLWKTSAGLLGLLLISLISVHQGAPNEDVSFHLLALYSCSINVYTTEVIFMLPVWAAQGAAMSVHSLPIKSRKSSAQTQYTPVPYTSLWWPCACHRHRLPETKWQCSRTCFCDFEMSVPNKLDHKLAPHNAVSLLYPTSNSRASDAPLLVVPFKGVFVPVTPLYKSNLCDHQDHFFLTTLLQWCSYACCPF